MRPLVIGSRASRLAMAQTEMVASQIRKLAPASECARGRSLAVRVVQMLTKLCASLQPKSTETQEAA